MRKKTLPDRIRNIKDHFSILDMFVQDFPHLVRGGLRGRDRLNNAHCPFHDDRKPSFLVDHDGFRCMSCGATGDIIEYVMKRDNLNKNDAIEYLAVQMGLPETKRSVPTRKDQYRRKGKKLKPPFTLADLKPYEANFKIALPYFEGRAIKEPVAKHHHLGAQVPFRWNYFDNDGVRHVFDTPRYAIPNVWADKWVMGVNFRRDDAACITQLKSLPKEHMAKLGQDVAAKWGIHPNGITSWDMLLDDLFGPKYWKRPGSINTVFNLDRIVKIDQKTSKFVPRNNWHIFIVESEICAMSLEQAGYPAIAVKWTHSMNLIPWIREIGHIWILRDNDQSGRTNALQVTEHLHEMGKRNVTILTPPKDLSDPNDIVVKGKIDSWMRKIAVRPTLPYRTDYKRGMFL